MAASAAAVFVLSGAVIALELALMRCLAIARWHNFSYLVISTALLGFGASGTLLAFVGRRMQRRFRPWATALTVAFALSVTASFRAAEALPLNARYVLYDGRQAALMCAYHICLFVPFLLGATVIGLSLMQHGRRVHLIYAANLTGSGLGAALAVGLMFLMPAERLLHAVAGMAVAAALAWSLGGGSRGRRLRVVPVAAVAAWVAAEAVLMPVSLEVGEYKMLSTLRWWEQEGRARHVLTRHGPRARLDVYDSPLLHNVMSAGLGATDLPPPQCVILADGEPAGTVLKIRSPGEAATLDHTPMSVPYRMVDVPRVLLLGEVGGGNVWLARRMGAEHVTVVQSNPQVVRILQGPLADVSGGVFEGGDKMRVVTGGPRLFLERSAEQFDIIQIVSAETLAAEEGGLRALHEDFMLTCEGLALCIEHLSPRGVLAVTRGVQHPPRDNVKLFATVLAAIESLGVDEPGARMAQVRNYLAATTMAFGSPMTAERCRALARAADALSLDVEWAPCPDLLRDEQVTDVGGPAGKPYSYFRHAALAMLSGGRREFFSDWLYNVRPATDDSPYFHNFFRWRSLGAIRAAYGPQWFTRLELGYVVLAFVLAEVLAAGVIVIILPLPWLRRAPGVRGARWATCAYFTLLGLGFMMLEMAFLLKFTYFLGDAIYAAACVITSFLVFSGLGSATSRRLCGEPRRAVVAGAAGAAAIALLYVFGLDAAFGAMVGWSLAGRTAASVVMAAPLAFLMGWPFPNGLTLVRRTAPSLVPWAWGTNGFASVAASPLAVMIAVGAGYRTVLVLAAGLYLVALACSARLATAEGKG